MKLKLYARKTMKLTSTIGVIGTAATLCGSAFAQGGAASGSVAIGSGGVSTSGDASAAAPVASSGGSVPYMSRYIPEPNVWEIGLFGGVMFPSSKHELVEPGTSRQAPFKTAGEIGFRVAYFPLAFVGAELEAAGMPTKVDTNDPHPAGGLYAIRGHVVGQLPIASITPFALIGMGALGGASNVMGGDVDPAFHFGVGAKAAIDEYLSVRLDLRDTMTQKWAAAQGAQTHHPEILLGLTFSLERRKPDSDGDGVADFRDKCPTVAGSEQGCPPAPKEAAKAGEPAPCPVYTGPVDTDGDGRTDVVDKCPKEPAATADGCPLPEVKDTDGDGLDDTVDKCPKEPETQNGFKDDDGCPDELPAEVQRFSGVIKGIEFGNNSAVIRAGSKPLLDDAAKVLNQYPQLGLEISGHTDNTGSKERNTELSRLRAESVKKYLVEKGVAAERLETAGFGPDKPIASNATDAGRQQNRRIEFKVKGH